MTTKAIEFFQKHQKENVKKIQEIVEEGIRSGEITEITPPGYRINVCLDCLKKLGLQVKITVDDAIQPGFDFPFGEEDQPEGFCRCHICSETIYSYGKQFS